VPDCFAEAPNGILLVTNGVDAALRWDGYQPAAEPAGIVAPTQALTLSSSGSGTLSGTYFAYLRFVDRDGNVSDLSPISASFTVANKLTITYDNVTTTTDPKVVRRQVLRNTDGQVRTFYVDLDTTDLVSSSMSTSKTDDELSVRTEVPVLNDDGTPAASVHAQPPSYKRIPAHHLDRMFLAGEVVYAEGMAQVTFGGLTVRGVGTEWPSTFAGRYLHVTGGDKAYQVSSVDVATQTLTLSQSYMGPTDEFGVYAVRAAPGERRTVWYSEAGLPESWPAVNVLTLQEDGDEITGLMQKGSFVYFLERRHVYRLTFQEDPALDGAIFLASNRGCVNDRCWVVVDDVAYCLDEAGVHAFGGNADPRALSPPIQDVFEEFSDAEFKVNWPAYRYFHAAHFPDEEVIRWFVCMGGQYLPKHAIAFHYRSGDYWIEEYPVPIASSTRGAFARSGQTFLGGEARKVWALGRHSLDGAEPGAGTTRGTVTSAGLLSLTDSTAAFAGSRLVGSPVAIVAGRGKGQSRVIAAASATTLTLTQPWGVKPDATSEYQVGAIGWRWKSKVFRLADRDGNSARRTELLFKPVADEQAADLRVYYNHAADPEEWRKTRTADDDNGIACTDGDPDLVVDLAKPSGFVQKRLEANREHHADGARFQQVELRGYTSRSPFVLYQIIIDGAAG
jgi:hypothetical protein